MPSNVFTGQVQGLSKIATGTPAAFCRAVIGGTLTVDLVSHVVEGIGGQRVARKGLYLAKLDVECIGVDKTDLAKWFPTTAGVQVSAFPDFLVEADDGTNGYEWQLQAGQPATASISLSDADDAEVRYKLSAIFATPVQQARGTDAAVYNAYIGHTRNDIGVTFAAAAQGCMSFEITNDLGAQYHNPADAKVAGSKTKPEGCYVTKQDIRFSCATSNIFKLDDADVLGDAWTPIAIVVAMANGTAGENITATLSDMIPDGSLNMSIGAQDRAAFGHEFIPGTGTSYNRVVFT